MSLNKFAVTGDAFNVIHLILTIGVSVLFTMKTAPYVEREARFRLVTLEEKCKRQTLFSIAGSCRTLLNLFSTIFRKWINIFSSLWK